MALTKTINTNYGINVVDAYHRVETIQIKNKTEILFSVASYVQVDRDAIKEGFFSCAYDIDGSNPIEQAYVHLKTLPEFAGATDV